MADAIILFIVGILIFAASVTGAFLMISKARARLCEAEEARQPPALRDDLRRTDDYIRDLGQAATDDDLDRLARKYRNDKEQ